MTISVLIPSWRRHESLIRALDAVGRQSDRVDQIVVALKSDDHASASAVANWSRTSRLHVEVVFVSTDANLVRQMNAGLAVTRSDVVALTDDDAEPAQDWIARLRAAFTDPVVGGVGGRDVQANDSRKHSRVGQVSWFGRVTGNHHIGDGPAREVELLKGVNCCFRGDLLREIRFDERLRGEGNVSHWEMAVCFAFRHTGLKLIYDPAIVVNHHVAPRMDGDINARGGFERRSYVDGVHNEVLSVLGYLPVWRRIAYCLWHATIGTAATPGILQALRLVISRKASFRQAWNRLMAVRFGTRAAFETWRTS